MRIEINRLRKSGFEVLIDNQVVDAHEIWIEPVNPTIPHSIGLLRDETNLSDMQTEEILIKVHEFQVWNALTR